MTSVRTAARPPTQCPYCDHVSPEDSKFCNECGAALHLKPCPHCGSLNDITKTESCLRCGGAMLAQAALPPEEPVEPEAPAPPAPPQAANDALIVAEPPLMPPPGATLPRLGPSRAAIGLTLLAALGVASWYGASALRAAPPPAPVQAKTPPRLPVAEPAPVPATVAAPGPDPSPAPPAPVAVSKSDEPPGAPPPRAARRPATVAPAGAEPRGNDSRSSAIEPRAPNLGPCTSAVAALGLCSEAGGNSNSNPRQ